jgi:serine/threonine protein kinase
MNRAAVTLPSGSQVPTPGVPSRKCFLVSFGRLTAGLDWRGWDCLIAGRPGRRIPWNLDAGGGTLAAMDADAAPATSGDELPPPPSQPPAVAGYDLFGELGRGSAGVVYRARHRRLGRMVALKLLRAGALAGPAERERFFREARAAARLQHPQIVQVYDVGEHAGGPYLALEMVPGGNLARLLAAGPLPPRTAADLVATLATAVHYAHAQGVVHRDLKPANILLEQQDDRGQTTVAGEDGFLSPVVCPLSSASPKVTDFGLARLLADDPKTTASGAVVGTPSYMAPEQAAGAKAVSPATDVYALGAILYECLTGRPPFRAASVVETLDQVRKAEPVSPARLQPAVPRDLNTVCLKCLEKDPARRYATAAALAEDLRRFLADRPVLARSVGPWGRSWRWCRRNPRDAGLLAALVVTLAAGFAGVFGQWRRADGLYSLAETRRAAAERNLRRYEEAADDFAKLVDALETDQLFHLRSDPLRPELVIPALRRNQEFLARHGDDPNLQAETARAHFRVAVLTRLLAAASAPPRWRNALEPGRRALDALTAFAGEQPHTVQYRRDRAALTQNLGFLLHGTGQSAEGVRVLEDACRQRQALLDAQPDHLDYLSELASCWNDLGLAFVGANRLADAVAAQERAADLQRVAVRAAPQVARYRRLLCNHHFNRAWALVKLGRRADAAVAASDSRRVAPEDPEQWFREARILGLVAASSGRDDYADRAMAALRQALGHGFDDLSSLDAYSDLNSLRTRPDFQAMVSELNRRRTAAMSQPP